jgi:hypothetical protein
MVVVPAVMKQNLSLRFWSGVCGFLLPWVAAVGATAPGPPNKQLKKNHDHPNHPLSW